MEGIDTLREALNSFAKDFCDNRYKCLYEADAQVLLSRHLETKFNQEHKLSHNSFDDCDIGKAHREYPDKIPGTNTKILFDNVVLGNPSHSKSWYRQPIKYAIELKLVQINTPGVAPSDLSRADYIRFVDTKLCLLKEYQEHDLEFGMQLTLFHDLNEQETFLKNHSLSKNEKWREGFLRFRQNLENNPRVEYCFVDLRDQTIKKVIDEVED